MPLGGIQTYPIGEPTSALQFQDLIVETAYKIGCAYYGADGQGAPQVPVDAHDLTLCQRIVNKAIRMFINDGPPPNGWAWLRPVAQIDVWPQVDAGSSGSTAYLTSTGYNSSTNLTTLTLNLPSTASSTASSTTYFYPSMEVKNIYLGGNPPPGTPGLSPGTTSTAAVGQPFTVVNYLSATQIQVYGQPASSTFTNGSTNWAMIADGDYTMPADFSGQYVGHPTYAQNTNRGMVLQWTTEAVIRNRRANYNFETGTPYQCAVRLMATPSITTTTPGGSSLSYAPSRRRWSLMTWRIASEFLHIQFPYVLGFQNLVNLTDTPPCPFSHDEALKAACLAQAEFDVENNYGVAWSYYKTDALKKSWRIDAMSTPKNLGYMSDPNMGRRRDNPIETFRDYWYQRPTVNVNL